MIQNYTTLLMTVPFHQQSFLIKKLLKTLEREIQVVIIWFKENHILVNAYKFHTKFKQNLKRNSDMRNQYTLNIVGNQNLFPVDSFKKYEIKTNPKMCILMHFKTQSNKPKITRNALKAFRDILGLSLEF